MHLCRLTEVFSVTILNLPQKLTNLATGSALDEDPHEQHTELLPAITSLDLRFHKINWPRIPCLRSLEIVEVVTRGSVCAKQDTRSCRKQC